MKHYIRAFRAPLLVISAATAAVFAAAALAQAATTIGTDIQTDGMLSVTGTTTLSGSVLVGTATASPQSTLDVWGSPEAPGGVGRFDDPGGAATFTYGKDMGTQTFGGEDYTLDKPILTLRTPNGAVAPSSGIQTALLIQAQPYFGGQNTGTAITFGGGNSSSTSPWSYADARIVYFDDIANSTASRLQFQTGRSGPDGYGNPAFNPGLKLWEDGAATYGLDSDAYNANLASASGLFSIWATSTENEITAFNVIPVSGSGSLFRVQNSGSVGIGVTAPTASLEVATSSANATTTIVIGKSGQNKGSCLVLYDVTGAAVYVTVQGGALVVSPTSCK